MRIWPNIPVATCHGTGLSPDLWALAQNILFSLNVWHVNPAKLPVATCLSCSLFSSLSLIPLPLSLIPLSLSFYLSLPIYSLSNLLSFFFYLSLQDAQRVPKKGFLKIHPRVSHTLKQHSKLLKERQWRGEIEEVRLRCIYIYMYIPESYSFVHFLAFSKVFRLSTVLSKSHSYSSQKQIESY